MDETPNIDYLKRHADALAALLADPHPGLISWRIALNDHLKALADFYEDREEEIK